MDAGNLYVKIGEKDKVIEMAEKLENLTYRGIIPETIKFKDAGYLYAQIGVKDKALEMGKKLEEIRDFSVAGAFYFTIGERCKGKEMYEKT